MKNNFKKFDYIFLFIAVLGVITLITLVLWGPKKIPNDHDYKVMVVVPASKDISLSTLASIKSLYFSNSINVVTVDNITKQNDGSLLIVFEASGGTQSSGVIFAGQKIGINQRIKVHGIFDGEGTITDIKAIN